MQHGVWVGNIHKIHHKIQPFQVCTEDQDKLVDALWYGASAGSHGKLHFDETFPLVACVTQSFWSQRKTWKTLSLAKDTKHPSILVRSSLDLEEIFEL